MNAILIFPPFSSSTSSPPAGLPALKAALDLNQIEASILDLNIEFIHYVMDNWDDFYAHMEEKIIARITDESDAEKRNYYAKILYIYGHSIKDMWTEKRSNELIVQMLFETINCYFFDTDLKESQHIFWSKRKLEKHIDGILNDKFIMDFFLSKIKNHNHLKLIGLSFLSETQLPYGLALSKMIRNNFMDLKIAAGGPYITEITKDEKSTVFLLDYFDYLSVYEGESAIIEIYRSICSGSLIAHRNVLTKGNVTIKEIAYESIDLLPTLNFEGLKLNLYLNNDLSLPFYSSKGCNWGRCTFCSLSGNKYREKNIELIVKDLEKIIKETGSRHFQFVDENIPPTRLRAISEAIIANNIEIRWFVQTRFDKDLDYGTLLAMKQAGCYLIEFGLESGSLEILKKIKKGISLTHVKEIIDNSDKLGVEVILNCMIGFPEEKIENAIETVEFLDSITKDKTSLKVSCNTQIVKIYKTSKYAETDNVFFENNLFSTIVAWENPYWVPEFIRKYKDHVLFNNNKHADITLLNTNQLSKTREDYYIELNKSCIFIQGICYDFNQCEITKGKLNYLMVVNQANKIDIYMLNEVMNSLIHILLKGKMKVVNLKKYFLMKYKDYKEDALHSLLEGIIRLNEIGAISIW